MTMTGAVMTLRPTKTARRSMTLASPRRPHAVLLLALASCASHSDDPLQKVRGPIPTRIHQPVGLIFPGPQPRRAQLLDRGEGRVAIDASYSSIFERNVQPGNAASFDGEIARLGARIAYGIAPGMEIMIEPVLLFASSGFLDQFVDNFHSATGFAGGGREDFPRDQYSMRLRKNGQLAWELEEDQILLGDLPITYLAQVRDEDDSGPAIAARVMLEIPTGDDDRGGGSGGWDTSAGFLLERSVGRWTFTGGLDGVYVDQPESFVDASIDIRTYILAAGGVEYRWSDRMSLLFQTVFQSPITRSLTFEEIDREILDLGFGCAWDVGRNGVMTFSFHEDAVAASGPDLVFYFGYAMGF